MTTNYKRRKYFIKKDDQGKFIFKFVFVSCLGTLMTIAIFNFLSQKKLEKVLYAMKLPKQPGEILSGEMLFANAIAVIVIIVTFIVVSRIILVRLGGPLRKLGSDVAKMGDGNLNVAVRLRDGDEFQDFANEVDEMREELRGRLGKITRITSELAALANEASIRQDFSGSMQQLARKSDELKQELHKFKT